MIGLGSEWSSLNGVVWCGVSKGGDKKTLGEEEVGVAIIFVIQL